MNVILARGAAIAATAAATVGAKRVAEFGWERFTGDEPPTAGDVGDDSNLRDLLLWFVVVTTVVAIARTVARKGAQRLT